MFQSGVDKGVTWTKDAGAAAVAINITGYSEEDGGDTPEISHTGTNGQQAFLAALRRCPCQIDLNYDTGQTPKSIGLIFGAKGTFAFTTGTTGGVATSDSIHVIIEKVGKKSVVNGVVSMSVTAKSDAIKADGTVVNSIDIT